MGKIKSVRTFNGEKFTYVGGRYTKKKAQELAAQGRANGYNSRVQKTPKTSMKTNKKITPWLVWGSVKKRKKR